MATDSTIPIPELQSSKSGRRLEQISALRSRGVGDHIGLPQLVVCGDQSSGKSSVLEGLTGLPFPRQDGVCTRFPTEIILEHSSAPMSIEATIIPASSREGSVRAALAGYRRQLKDFLHLPEVISEVGSLMGIRGFGTVKDGPAFVEDVLRIKMTGPTGMHLSVVDLPGMISVPGEDQTEEDMVTVQRMVDSYLSNQRTIVLATIQASNDVANQSVIQKTRRVKGAAQRTVGVITKPDLINKGTEPRIARLARNEDTTKLALGFFIVKNPTPAEMESGITAEQRQKAEMKFFRSPPWKDLGLGNRVGILALRSHLQTLLDGHIERELPKVRNEIKELMREKEQEIQSMGERRQTLGEMRTFVSRLSTKFHNLVVAGVSGHYFAADADFFRGTGIGPESTRLRAVIDKLNREFSDRLCKKGEKRVLIKEQDESFTLFQPDEPIEAIKSSNSEDLEDPGQIKVTQAEMNEWVKKVS